MSQSNTPGRIAIRSLTCALLCIATAINAQTPATDKTDKTDNQALAGDAPTDAPPMATDLTPKLDKKDISHAMQKVADWQLNKAQANFNQDWTFATLYAGLMAVPDSVRGSEYRGAMLVMGKRFDWQPGPRVAHADDLAVGQAYLDLYRAYLDPTMLAPVRERADAVMLVPDDPEKPLWWWCDALFMAPPVFSSLTRITGDKKYLDFMDKQWWITSGLLYDQKTHLFFRDKSFLDKHEANGSPLFWSRGNGWVMAGLVRVLTEMPHDYPSRDKYVTQFKDMAKEVASLQGADGLWRPGLLDAGAYKLPEVSGSAFFTYAMAYGVNAGLLERKQYQPVIEKAWAGLLSHIYQNGRLGCIQPIGAEPGEYTPTSSYVYGVGAFLLAGSEVIHLEGGSHLSLPIHHKN